MRFIDNSLMRVPDGWGVQADNARQAVLDPAADVSAYAAVWRALKDVLADLSHDKCWYCEMKQLRSDNAVDHFRPKSIYRWLAFAQSNFRYSCTFCNSRRTDSETGIVGGKGDYFPLADGTPRATAPGQEADERPLLLNPCAADDPLLLDFNDEGRPVPRFADQAESCLRAETSIRLYHLDHSDLVEHRRVLAIELNEKIDAANRLYGQVNGGDPAIKASYGSHVRDLRNAMSERAQLSVFARKIVSGRRDLPWIEALLLV